VSENNLIQRYIELRDKRSARRRTYELADEADRAEQESIEAELLNFFSVMGVQSARSEAATAYISTRTSATVNDWVAFKDFVIANSAFDLLEYRCNKFAAEKYTLDNGKPPPGVELSSCNVINVRRTAPSPLPDTNNDNG
jgi:hypothetical protein